MEVRGLSCHSPPLVYAPIYNKFDSKTIFLRHFVLIRLNEEDRPMSRERTHSDTWLSVNSKMVKVQVDPQTEKNLKTT